MRRVRMEWITIPEWSSRSTDTTSSSCLTGQARDRGHCRHPAHRMRARHYTMFDVAVIDPVLASGGFDLFRPNFALSAPGRRTPNNAPEQRCGVRRPAHLSASRLCRGLPTCRRRLPQCCPARIRTPSPHSDASRGQMEPHRREIEIEARIKSDACRHRLPKVGAPVNLDHRGARFADPETTEPVRADRCPPHAREVGRTDRRHEFHRVVWIDRMKNGCGPYLQTSTASARLTIRSELTSPREVGGHMRPGRIRLVAVATARAAGTLATTPGLAAADGAYHTESQADTSWGRDRLWHGH
jgi:hypothetical protein